MHLADMFAAILGHDLRTPLSAIKMSAELIVRESEDARTLRLAGRILSADDRMTRMIEQLLDFARVRQGRGIELKVTSADLVEISRPVLEELGDANPQARIELSVFGDLTGNWDPDRLAQVVSNIVGNAVQHGALGSPIRVELNGTEAGVVRLRCRNSGAIPAEALPTLFEPFKRPLPRRTGKKGLGLGLFIAREIVHAHGGNIAVQSHDTTTFEITLPREASPVDTAVLTAT
ncbi:MAG TPA: HAMP domain-containing sensor histidine kinase [Polyangiaceae bacterium]|nr:HAMP domain-containing sensor histidine kinase [Polyangiaceae bacterium]